MERTSMTTGTHRTRPRAPRRGRWLLLAAAAAAGLQWALPALGSPGGQADAAPLDRAEAALREAQDERAALLVEVAASHARIDALLARPVAVDPADVYQVWDDTKRQVHAGPLLIQRMVGPGEFEDVVWLNAQSPPADPPAAPAEVPPGAAATPAPARPDLLTRRGSYHFNGHQRGRTVAGVDLTPSVFRKEGDDVRAVAFVGQGSDLTIGPLRASGFRDAITIEGHDGPFEGVLVTGVHVYDNHASGRSYKERSSGLYAAKVNGLVIEDSIFDRNGWAGVDDDRDKYSHNIYLYAENGPATIRRTVISRASACGIQLRPGGVIEDSLIYGNAIGGYAARADSTLRRCVIVGNRQQFGVGSGEAPVNLTFEDCLFLFVAPDPIPGIAEDPKALWLQHPDSTVTMRGCITVDAGELKIPDAMKGDTREGTCTLTREQVYRLCELAATGRVPLAMILAELRNAVE